MHAAVTSAIGLLTSILKLRLKAQHLPFFWNQSDHIHKQGQVIQFSGVNQVKWSLEAETGWKTPQRGHTPQAK